MWSEGPIKMVFPRKGMDPKGFLMALREFPVVLSGDPVTALANLWHGGKTRPVHVCSSVVSLTKCNQTGSLLYYGARGDETSGTEARVTLVENSGQIEDWLEFIGKPTP